MKKSLLSAILLTLSAFASVASAQIQLSFSTVQPTCNGFTNGSATVSAVGGAGAYTYAWSTGQITQGTFGIGAGTYTVTVTDAAQLTASGSVTVSEPSAVLPAITATDVSCEGTSGTLTAAGFGGTPPYSYVWGGQNSSSSESVAVIAPGNYFVTVTDANACAGVASFTVATPILLDVLATDIPCSIYPDGGAVTAIATGGVTPYTYSWSNGSSAQMQTGIGAGPYVATVTSANGCVAVDSDFVDIPTPLEVELIWLTPACGGNNNGSATVQASGGTPPYTHTWTPGNLTGASQTGLAPGQYYVCTFDANQCQKDIWVNIEATTGLDVQLVVTSATCIGINDATATAVVSPLGSGYVYQWNILPPDSNVTQVGGLAAGTTISVTVTDPVSGCSGTATGVVGAHSNIEVDVTDVDILCAGGFGSAVAVASNGTPQYTYTWLNGNGDEIGQNASIDGLTPGAYLVTVVDSLGCIGQAVADIGIQSEPHAVIDGDSVLVCGDSLSVVQFTNLSYDNYNSITTLVWTVTGPSIDTVITNENQVVFQLPVDETITVQLIATSGLGCSDTTSLQYNVPGFPDISLSLDSTTINCVGEPVQINVIGGDSTYTYVWAPSVTLNPNPLHVLVSPTQTTTYTLTATDGNACSTIDSITVAPLDSLYQLFLSDTLIQTCDATATLSATTTIPATIVWTDENGTVIPGNPITVPATPTTTVYTATATTADTCVLTGSVSVTGFGLNISLDTAVDSTICEGDSLPLSVIVTPPTDSLTYHWSVTGLATLSDSTSAQPILTGAAGICTVRVIVANAFCADTLEFPITILSGFNLDGHITAGLCEGLTVSFTNDSGMPGVWNFGDDSQSSDINPVHVYDTAGQYMVIFTPAIQFQCTAPWDSMIMVQQDTLLADIGHLYVDCALKAVIQFNGSTNFTGTFDWDWNFSNGTPDVSSEQNPMINFTEEGDFIATLVVTDVNNCTATASDTVTVDILFDNIEENLSICPEDSVGLNAVGIDTAATYVWTSVPNDPELEANNPNPVVSPNVPTTYSVAINKGLCSVNYSVFVDLKPGSDVSLPNDTLVVCNADTLSITAQSNGALGYEWSNSPTFSNIFATTQTVEVLPNGTYYVRTTGSACVAVDSIKIDQGTAEIQVLPTDNDICAGEETALMLSNLIPDQILTYDWTPDLPNVANPIVSPLETTTYTVVATNQFGCTASLSFTVNVTNVSVDATASASEVSALLPTITLTATPGGNGNVISYEWTPPGTLSSPNTAQTEATPIGTTVYTVKVTTDDGCVAIDSVVVNYRFSECIDPFVFIPNAFSPNNDSRNDFFKIYAAELTALKLIVWNRWGEIVFETDDINTIGWDGTYKGKEATGDSFAWYARVVCGDGAVYENKGNVTLLK